MTDTGPISELSENAGCGITISYNAAELAHEVISLVSDKPQYENMRKLAIAFAKKYDWEQIFSRSFQ
jgi:glycosyltransferase involved in cell wall biosynthesis